MKFQSASPRRLAWIVNHRTLMPAEVPILRSLGWEVFVPKIIPDHDPSFRSASITYEYDKSLTLGPQALEVLNRHAFYTRQWSPTLAQLMNENFQAVVISISGYLTPLCESARHFSGTVVARVFGRERPFRYSDLFTSMNRPELLKDLAALGDRFAFGQGYDNIAEIEDEPMRSRAHTITVPLPGWVFNRQDSWTGKGSHALLLCPAVADGGYYQAIYRRDKRDFGDLPHLIFGRQLGPVNDPAVLPYQTDEALLSLYAAAPVFLYPSVEPRHIHYSPLEAMVVGTPVLYHQGTLTDLLGGDGEQPGRCASVSEMREKAKRLLAGDRALAESIRAAQPRILDSFAPELATHQWRWLLDTGQRRAAA
jgi:glycosyltransferase involved in cell wall biosynthesis